MFASSSSEQSVSLINRLMLLSTSQDEVTRFRVVPTGSAVNVSGVANVGPQMQAAMNGAPVVALETTDKVCPASTRNAGKNHVNY